MHERSGAQSRKATGAAASNLDLYQVNCTYYDALGRRDLDYLIARTIQFWAPGIPQVYYVGALGGVNDMDLLAKSGVGRDINRHYYTAPEVTSALQKPMVRSLLGLIRFRNAHTAFNGEFSIEPTEPTALSLTWRRANEWASLDVDLSKPSAVISYTSGAAIKRHELSATSNPEITL